MTEQEAIEMMQGYQITDAVDRAEYDAFQMAIDALEEIQKYKNIGVSSADELEQDLLLHKADGMVLNEYKAIGTVEEIKKLVRFLSIDNDREIIKELEELRDYVSIGTIEECREAMERQRAKKPNKRANKYTDLIQHYSCPVCGKYFGQAGVRNIILFDKPKYCTCGQAIDWSDGK